MDKSVSEFLQCPRLTATGDITGGLRWFLLIYFGAFAVSAVLTPLVFLPLREAWLTNPEALPAWLAPLTSRLEPSDFPRWFDRLRWLPVVAALPFLLRMTGLASLRGLGFRGSPGLAGRAFVVAVLMFLPVALIQEIGFGTELRGTRFIFVTGEMLFQALLGALVISLLEETIFRGLILRVFTQAMKPWLAIGLSALFFALVHFKRVDWPVGQEVNWFSGVWAAEAILLAPLHSLKPLVFLNLLAAGILLNLVMIKWRSLWPCVGLHAGWVCYRQLHREFFPEPAVVNPIIGGPALIDGLLALLVLGLAITWMIPRCGVPIGIHRPPPNIWPELILTGRDTLKIFENAVTVMRNTARHAWKVAVLLCATLLLLSFFEDPWLEAIRQPRGTVTREAAGWVSAWGDFYRLNLIILPGGLFLAWMRRSMWLRRASVAVFLAALMAGVAVNVLRPTIGRPRPSAGLEDGLYGPNLAHEYHGFPSGHAATAFATGTTIAIVAPPAALPALGGATLIAVSRIALNQHHPTDSIAGAALGSWFGLAFGYAARRRDYIRLEPGRW